MLVTIWHSTDTLKAFLGADWDKSVIPEEERPFIASATVEHYEVYGESTAGRA